MQVGLYIILQYVVSAFNITIIYFILVDGDRPRGFGFVTYEDPNDAEDAVKAVHNMELQGRNIRVEISTGKKRDDRGRGGRDSYRRDDNRDSYRDRDHGRGRSRSRDRSRDRYDDRRDRDRGGRDDRRDGRDRSRDRDRY